MRCHVLIVKHFVDIMFRSAQDELLLLSHSLHIQMKIMKIVNIREHKYVSRQGTID